MAPFIMPPSAAFMASGFSQSAGRRCRAQASTLFKCEGAGEVMVKASIPDSKNAVSSLNAEGIFHRSCVVRAAVSCGSYTANNSKPGVSRMAGICPYPATMPHPITPIFKLIWKNPGWPCHSPSLRNGVAGSPAWKKDSHPARCSTHIESARVLSRHLRKRTPLFGGERVTRLELAIPIIHSENPVFYGE